MLLAGTALFAGPPPPTVTTLSFVPSASVPQFSAASAAITVTSAGLPVTSGTVKLYQAKTQGVPGSCAAQNGNAEVQPPLSATPDTNGQATFALYQAGLTNTIGTFGYIAKFTDPGSYDSSSSACLDLTILTSGPECDHQRNVCELAGLPPSWRLHMEPADQRSCLQGLDERFGAGRDERMDRRGVRNSHGRYRPFA